MKLLAIDTATECCSAALWLDGDCMAREHHSPRDHSSVLLPMIDGLLVDAGLRLRDLDGLAFGRGPGGFTGVRIATGVIQGLAFGAGLPVWPVSNLTALAEAARRRMGATSVLAVLDARMREVYWSAVEFAPDGTPRLLLPESVSAPGIVHLPDAAVAGEWIGVGPGWAAYAAELATLVPRLRTVDGELLPHARDIAALAARATAAGEPPVAPHEVAPVYLRDRVAGGGP